MVSESEEVVLSAGLILLDLHGLHVSEALKMMGREMRQLQQGNGKGRAPIRVQILVGTGPHTKVRMQDNIGLHPETLAANQVCILFV